MESKYVVKLREHLAKLSFNKITNLCGKRLVPGLMGLGNDI
jgi:hypothetical protein